MSARIWLSIICIGLIVISCDHEPERVDLTGIESGNKVYRFDQALFDCSIEDFSNCTKGLNADYFPFFESGDSSFWYKQRTDSLLLSLKKDLDPIESEIQQALSHCDNVLRHYEYYFNGRTPGRTYTYISPLDFDFPLFISDTMTFIALDQYLGSNSPYYRSQPEYLMRGRALKFLPLDLAEALAQQQVYRDQTSNNDLLSAMIYEGKILYLTNRLNPDVTEYDLLRYSPSELEFCRKNEENMWSYLIEQQALFSSDADLKRRLILPAPFSKFYLPIDSQTPGRVGRWIGLRIVQERMKQGDIDLVEMIRITDSRKLLRDAKYKP